MIKKSAQSIVIVLSEKMQMDVTIESSDCDVTGVCDITLPSSVHEFDIADISLADSNDFNLTDLFAHTDRDRDLFQLIPTCSTPKRASITRRSSLNCRSLDANADISLPDSENSIALTSSITQTLSTNAQSILGKIQLHSYIRTVKLFKHDFIFSGTMGYFECDTI